MKCPKCGYELAEDHLYCDNCGEEIRIVPDYEPEIEREINESMATLLVELAAEEIPELAGEIRKEKTEPFHGGSDEGRSGEYSGNEEKRIGKKEESGKDKG